MQVGGAHNTSIYFGNQRMISAVTLRHLVAPKGG